MYVYVLYVPQEPHTFNLICTLISAPTIWPASILSSVAMQSHSGVMKIGSAFETTASRAMPGSHE